MKVRRENLRGGEEKGGGVEGRGKSLRSGFRVNTHNCKKKKSLQSNKKKNTKPTNKKYSNGITSLHALKKKKYIRLREHLVPRHGRAQAQRIREGRPTTESFPFIFDSVPQIPPEKEPIPDSPVTSKGGEFRIPQTLSFCLLFTQR